MSERGRTRRSRRSRRRWRELQRKLKWAWFYVLAALLVLGVTWCAMHQA